MPTETISRDKDSLILEISLPVSERVAITEHSRMGRVGAYSLSLPRHLSQCPEIERETACDQRGDSTPTLLPSRRVPGAE